MHRFDRYADTTTILGADLLKSIQNSTEISCGQNTSVVVAWRGRVPH